MGFIVHTCNFTMKLRVLYMVSKKNTSIIYGVVVRGCNRLVVCVCDRERERERDSVSLGVW